jgi:hypothetical protein
MFSNISPAIYKVLLHDIPYTCCTLLFGQIMADHTQFSSCMNTTMSMFHTIFHDKPLDIRKAFGHRISHLLSPLTISMHVLYCNEQLQVPPVVYKVWPVIDVPLVFHWRRLGSSLVNGDVTNAIANSPSKQYPPYRGEMYNNKEQGTWTYKYYPKEISKCSIFYITSCQCLHERFLIIQKKNIEILTSCTWTDSRVKWPFVVHPIMLTSFLEDHQPLSNRWRLYVIASKASVSFI